MICAVWHYILYVLFEEATLCVLTFWNVYKLVDEPLEVLSFDFFYVI